MKAVYAVVDTVKPITSRGVSVIQLEVPIEDHIAVTNLLFGKTAVLVPMELEGVHRYGVQDTDNPVMEAPREPKKHNPIARLLGQWCKTESFWEWLTSEFEPIHPVEDEEVAAVMVRQILEIDSRGDIDGNAYLEDRFQKLIRHPYMAWMEERL